MTAAEHKLLLLVVDSVLALAQDARLEGARADVEAEQAIPGREQLLAMRAIMDQWRKENGWPERPS